MIRVNIIAWHNGGGLSRDVDILVDALPAGQFEVTLNGKPVGDAGILKRRIYHRMANARTLALKKQALASSTYDINLFLEDIVPGFFRYARANAFIPNPEWFKPGQVRHLPALDAVLCKTRSAEESFDAFGGRTRFISFTSEDRLQPPGEHEAPNGYLHLAGRSWQKGTRPLTDLWQAHPEWPVLTVVQSERTYNRTRVKPIEAANIDHVLERVDDDALKRLQNSHAVHLCPSEAEGFGHVIAEAMSCRALTLTTNAPPMNELVTDDRGILVDYTRTERQRAGMSYFVDPADLERKILGIIAMDSSAAERLGNNARSWFENNDSEFRRLICTALADLA